MLRLLPWVLLCMLLLSCKKDLSNNDNETLSDLSTKVISVKVYGFVTDENNEPVNSASITVGSLVTTTNKYGYFEVTNAEVVKNAAVVTVTKAGYFKGIRTYIGADGKSAFVRIKLIPKTVAGTVNGTSGGDVTLANGLKVSFPANGVMVDGSGAAYSGNVNVAAYWINPTSNDMPLEMPGDLRALNIDDELRQLTTYGMIAVELTGSAGEDLQVATGKKATVTIPIPASIMASAPATIALWHFDEAKGLWVEEGTATKAGNNYVGEVSHFSFWNVDIPNRYVLFSCKLIDVDGDPVSFSLVKFYVVNNPQNAAWGTTDHDGNIVGAIPANSTLGFEVYSYSGCNNPYFTQTLTTSNANVDLGIITVTSSQASTKISGIVTNCSNTVVSNGVVQLFHNNYYTLTNVNSDGTFTCKLRLCDNASIFVKLIAHDIDNAQESPEMVYTIQPGNNAIGNLKACGVQTNEFINITVDGITDNYTFPRDSILYQYNSLTNPPVISIDAQQNILVSGTPTTIHCGFSISEPGITAGSTQFLTRLTSSRTGFYGFQSPYPYQVNITEYGPIGQFISGNFSGIITSISTPQHFSCNFRIRRTQ